MVGTSLSYFVVSYQHLGQALLTHDCFLSDLFFQPHHTAGLQFEDPVPLCFDEGFLRPRLPQLHSVDHEGKGGGLNNAHQQIIKSHNYMMM